MPIALDPNETAPVWLRSDADKPEAERPVFLFRYLTARHRRQVFQWLEDARQKEADSESLVNKVILFALAGWRNMGGVAFEPTAEKLDEVLTESEKIELAVNYPFAVADAEVLKKNQRCDSASSPATASSVPPAPPPASV